LLGFESSSPACGPSALLTCREVVDFLAAYLEEELPGAKRGEFDRHLAVCRPCVAYLEGYRWTVALGHALGAHDLEIPSPAPERLIAAILAARRRL